MQKTKSILIWVFLLTSCTPKTLPIASSSPTASPSLIQAIIPPSSNQIVKQFKNPYPPDVLANYFDVCFNKSKNTKNYCECTIRKAQDLYPLNEFSEAYETAAMGKKSDKMDKVLSACLPSSDNKQAKALAPSNQSSQLAKSESDAFKEDLEDILKRTIVGKDNHDSNPKNIGTINCPVGIKLEVGKTFNCQIQINQKSIILTVAFKNVPTKFEIKPDGSEVATVLYTTIEASYSYYDESQNAAIGFYAGIPSYCLKNAYDKHHPKIDDQMKSPCGK